MRWLGSAYGATLGRRRSLTIVVLLMLAMFGLGFANGFWLPMRLGYLLLLTLVAAYGWTWLSGRGMRVAVARLGDRVQAGQTIIERLEVRNESRLPKLWLEVEEIADLPDHAGKHVVSLGAQGRRSWRLETVCQRRGLYTLGPIVVRSGDPFGLFQTQREFGQPHQVLVYPRPLELPHYAVPPANLPGEGRFRRRTHYVTPNASGIRDYEPGDSVNRIHWPSTLRTGRMMVKTFELDPASHHWVVLDLHRGDHAGQGDDASVEYGVSAAASIARLFLAQSRTVGLMAFGSRLETVEPERGSQHLSRILEALALAQPIGDVPLGTLLYQQARRWGRHTTLVIVTGATDQRWADAVRLLVRRGVKVAVVLLDLQSFGGRRGAVETALLLRGTGVQINRVARGDSLPEVLAPPLALRGAEALVGT